MEFQTPTIQPNTFTWIIKDFEMNGKFVSNFFQFCRYPCQLLLEAERKLSHDSTVTISLLGYPAPFIENLCHYSLILKNNKGKVYGAKSGKVQVDEKSRIVLYTGNFYYYYGYPNIYISWYKDEEISCQIKSTQTEFGISSSGLECATQTEGSLPLNTVSSKDVIEQATQTESTQSSEDSSIIKGNKTIKFLEVLSRDLGSFYEGQMEPDCVLNVGDSKFPVHRSLLSARSTVFAAMFHHDTSESRSGEVNIPDSDAAIFSDVIFYMYTGKVRGLSPDTAATIYTAADKYALIELRDECLEFLKNNLTVENVCDAAVLSHSHAEVELENEVVEFIKGRLHELMGSENWKLFSDKHYKLANKLVCTALIAFQTGKI